MLQRVDEAADRRKVVICRDPLAGRARLHVRRDCSTFRLGLSCCRLVSVELSFGAAEASVVCELLGQFIGLVRRLVVRSCRCWFWQMFFPAPFWSRLVWSRLFRDGFLVVAFCRRASLTQPQAFFVPAPYPNIPGSPAVITMALACPSPSKGLRAPVSANPLISASRADFTHTHYPKHALTLHPKKGTSPPALGFCSPYLVRI